MKYIFSFCLLSLLCFAISTEVERETSYFGYVIREQTENGTNDLLKFRQFITQNGNQQLTSTDFTSWSIEEEKSLAPFHLVKIKQFQFNVNDTIKNKNYLVIDSTTNESCLNGNNIYCKYIPHTFSVEENPAKKKHFVIWIHHGCYYSHYFYARIRNFDDISEAREYFKKVFYKLKGATNPLYVILLISKEGLSILEEYDWSNEDSGKILVKFLKGEGIGYIC